MLWSILIVVAVFMLGTLFERFQKRLRAFWRLYGTVIALFFFLIVAALLGMDMGAHITDIR